MVYTLYSQVHVKSGEMLYLPCGWFHEVTSFGSNNPNNPNNPMGEQKGSDIHQALNFWFYPPDNLSTDNLNNPSGLPAGVKGSFNDPYSDPIHWAQKWRDWKSEHPEYSSDNLDDPSLGGPSDPKVSDDISSVSSAGSTGMVSQSNKKHKKNEEKSDNPNPFKLNTSSSSLSSILNLTALNSTVQPLSLSSSSSSSSPAVTEPVGPLSLNSNPSSANNKHTGIFGSFLNTNQASTGVLSTSPASITQSSHSHSPAADKAIKSWSGASGIDLTELAGPTTGSGSTGSDMFDLDDTWGVEGTKDTDPAACNGSTSVESCLDRAPGHSVDGTTEPSVISGSTRISVTSNTALWAAKTPSQTLMENTLVLNNKSNNPFGEIDIKTLGTNSRSRKVSRINTNTSHLKRSGSSKGRERSNAHERRRGRSDSKKPAFYGRAAKSKKANRY